MRDAEDPRVRTGQVRIRVTAAGVNFADVAMRVGIYPDIPELPAVTGYEIAGEIESVGADVTGLEPGRRVCAALPHLGGFAELVVAESSNVFPLPDPLSPAEGAALPLTYTTAYAALFVMTSVHAGESVLVHSAAGGVGMAALQLLADCGTTVIGACSAAKHDAVLAAGAAHAIDYRDLRDRVRQLTDGRGVDIVLDALGRTRESYALLRPGGRLVAYGFTGLVAGRKGRLAAGVQALPALVRMPRFSPLRLATDNKAVMGLSIQRWWAQRSVAELMQPVLERAARGTVKPVIAATFPLAEAALAHRYIEERRNVGKVVLQP